MTEKTVSMLIKSGANSRWAANVAFNVARKFKSKIMFYKGDEVADAKSIMSIIVLAICYGTEIKIVAEGEDEKEAIEAIVPLFDFDGIDF